MAPPLNGAAAAGSPHPHLRRLLQRNAISSGGTHVVRNLIALAITPYVLAKLGTTQYGLWAMASVITSWAQLADLGMGRSLIKFYSQYHGEGRPEEISRLVWLATVAYGLVGVGALATLLPIRGWVLGVAFKVPPALLEPGEFVYVGVVLIFVANLVFTPFANLFAGLQRYDWLNGIGLAAHLAATLATVAFLELGMGLRGMVLKTGVQTLVSIAATMWGLRIVLGRFGMPMRQTGLFSRVGSRLRELLSFSVHVEMSYVVRLLYDPVNRIVLSNRLGLEYTAYYELGFRLLRAVEALFVRMTVVIFPAGSFGFMARGRDFVVRLYRAATKYIALGAAPLLLFLTAFSSEVMAVWLGNGYGLAALTLSVLALPLLVVVVANGAVLLVQSIGRPQYAMLGSVIRAAVHLPLLFVLLGAFGFPGMLLAAASSQVAGAAFPIAAFHRALNLRWTDLFSNGTIRAALAALGAVGLAVAMVKPLRVSEELGLGLGFLICTLVYAALLLRGGLLDHEDWSMLRGAVPQRIFNFLSARPSSRG